MAASTFTNGLQQITDIVVPPDANLLNLNLPIDPNGVVYNSMARIPVVGATLTLLNAGSGSPLPPGCFDDAAQQGQVTLADGYYKFDVNFSDPACPSGGDYVIAVTAPPGANYVAGYSQIIPPTSDASTTAFSVPGCPGSPADTRAGTGLYCEVQPSEFAPAPSVLARSAGTTHHVHLMLDGSQTPGSSQAFNNHIPLDPQLEGSVAISKTTPLLNVTRAQLVPYVITVNNVAGLLLTDVTIVDRYPAGFSYVAGSALLDGVPTEPAIAGRELRWNGLVFAGTQVRTVKLLLAVGGGVGEGEFVNRAQVMQGVTGAALSGEATATVRVLSDPTFDCTDVLGKVFNDANRNGVQDDGEEGLPGVRVVTARGLQADDRCLRALPHHVRRHAAREPRQQLRPEARRPDPSQRLPHVHRPGADQARHARQGPASSISVPPFTGWSPSTSPIPPSSRARPTSASSGARDSTCCCRSCARHRRCCACATSPTPRTRRWFNGAWRPSRSS